MKQIKLTSLLALLLFSGRATGDPPTVWHQEQLLGVSREGTVAIAYSPWDMEGPGSLGLEIFAANGQFAAYRRCAPLDPLCCGETNSWQGAGDPALLARLDPALLGTAPLKVVRARVVRVFKLTRPAPAALRATVSPVKQSSEGGDPKVIVSAAPYGSLVGISFSEMYGAPPSSLRLYKPRPSGLLLIEVVFANDYYKVREFYWLRPDQLRARSLARRGTRLLKNQRPQQAVTAFAAAQALDPCYFPGRLGLARALARAGVSWAETHPRLQLRPTSACALQRDYPDACWIPAGRGGIDMSCVTEPPYANDLTAALIAPDSPWFQRWQEEASQELRQHLEEQEDDQGEAPTQEAPAATKEIPGAQTGSAATLPLSCATGKGREFLFSKLYFAEGSAKIATSQQRALALNSAALTTPACGLSASKIALVGTTGEGEEAADPAGLGLARAQAVMQALIARGVEEGRLSAAASRRRTPADPDFKELEWSYGQVEVIVNKNER